jgi:hypothetical protein
MFARLLVYKVSLNPTMFSDGPRSLHPADSFVRSEDRLHLESSLYRAPQAGSLGRVSI